MFLTLGRIQTFNQLEWSVYTCLTQLYIVVLDKYTHSNLVYYKHNGDDEPYENNQSFQRLQRESNM